MCRTWSETPKTGFLASRHKLLKEKPSCVPNTTKKLIFHGNNLTYEQGQLHRFKLLINLDLSDNYKFVPHCDSFDGLTRLISLNLSSTKLEHLKPCVFHNMDHLLTLRLSCTRLRYISAELFRYLYNLNLLDLADSELYEITNNTFLSLQNLEHLDLGYNTGIVLNENSFLGLSKLKTLELSFDWIPNATSFPVSVFKPLAEISEINLLEVCSSFGMFYNCEAIDQRLSVISTLKILTVDNFVISLLGTGFTSLSNLKEIHFKSTFSKPVFSSCNISALSNRTFQNLRNSPISKISIHWCDINQIKPFAFSSFETLTYVSLDNIKVGQASREEKMEVGLQNSPIKHLRLRLQDEIALMPVPTLTGLNSSSLQLLEISYSPVYRVKFEFFKGLPVSLKHLHLSNNQIIIVCFCDLYRLEHLEILDLSHQDGQSDLQKDVKFSPKHMIQTEHTIVNTTSNRADANSCFISNDCSVCQKLPMSLRTIKINHSKLLCELVKVFCDSSNNLKYLDISHQSSSSDCFEIFWKMTKNISKLKYLNVAGSSLKSITNYAFFPTRLFKEFNFAI